MATKVKKSKDEKIVKTLNKLIEYQEINHNLDALVEEINKMREEMDEEEKKYTSKKNHYEKHCPILKKCEREHEELKQKLSEIKVTIEANEEKKKKIKTIKEFKAINNEIDELNKQNAILENALLTKEEELEFKNEKIKIIKETMDELELLISAKKEDLDALLTERKEEIAAFTEKKNTLEEGLSSKLVITFNRIYRNKEKMGIVEVKNQECFGCHMRVPFQVGVDVRRGEEIVYCTNCSRILYDESLKTETNG